MNKSKICNCVKELLIQCGFENRASLENINDTNLQMMEEYIKNNRNCLENLPECHRNKYQSQAEFNFLPGHRVLLLNLPQICKLERAESRSDDRIADNPAFSTMLKELIRTAVQNSNKTPNNYRYSDVVFDFAMYTFMMGGRALYEVLRANLPLPAVSTVRKSLTIFLFHSECHLVSFL